MTAMPAAVRKALDAEMATARTHRDIQVRWTASERAHILSQPWPWPHTKVHGLMFRLAIGSRDHREAAGQLLRLLVAAPGSVAGRYPTGNTGRASVGLTEPMPIPADLQPVLDQSKEPELAGGVSKRSEGDGGRDQVVEAPGR